MRDSHWTHHPECVISEQWAFVFRITGWTLHWQKTDSNKQLINLHRRTHQFTKLRTSSPPAELLYISSQIELYKINKEYASILDILLVILNVFPFKAISLSPLSNLNYCCKACLHKGPCFKEQTHSYLSQYSCPHGTAPAGYRYTTSLRYWLK